MTRTIQYEDPDKNGTSKKGLRELSGDDFGPNVNVKIKDSTGADVPSGGASDPVNVTVGTLPAILADYTEETPSGDSIQIIHKPTEHTFHDAAAAAADGTIFGCDGQYTKLILEVTKSAGVATLELDFLGSISSTGTIYQPLLGAKIGTDGSITTAVKSTSTTTEIWDIDVTGRKYLKMDLASITGDGATVTVKGVLL